MRNTDCLTGRFTLFAAAVFAGATLLCAAAGHATTPPIDWHLVVNVRPAVPNAHPTYEDRVRVWLHGKSTPDGLGLTFQAAVTDTTIRLQGHRVPVEANPVPFDWSQEVELPPLPHDPNCCQLEVYDEDLLIHSQLLEVHAPLHTLVFVLPDPQPVATAVMLATARLTDPLLGLSRDASAVQSTPGSGYFWFFDPDNVEVTVKVLDGRPVNGHLWLFLTGMTSLGLTVTVVQSHPCPAGVCATKTYVNPPGQRFNVIDTTTF